MRKYETIFILKSDKSEGEIKSQIKEVKDLIEKNNGVVHSVEDWGKKKLAYEIKKEKHGNYVFLTFDLGPEFISILEKNYRINENILRHLIVLRMKPSKKRDGEKEKKDISSWEVAEGEIAGDLNKQED